MDKREFAGLVVASPRLVFPFNFGSETATTLVVTNPSTERAAFKVMTTSPERYSVVPCYGLLKPGQSTKIKIRMRRYHHLVLRQQRYIDRFIIRSIKLNASVEQITPDLISGDQDKGEMYEVKLEAWLEEHGTDTSLTDVGSPQSARSNCPSVDVLNAPELNGMSKFSAHRAHSSPPSAECHRLGISGRGNSDEILTMRKNMDMLEKRLASLESHREKNKNQKAPQPRRRRGLNVIVYGLGFASGYFFRMLNSV